MSRPALDDKVIPTYSFPLITAVMEELGVEAEKLLGGTELNALDISTSVKLISYRQAMGYLKNLLHHSPVSHIGLVIGQRYLITTYGNLGYAMMSCSDWLEAMIVGVKYHKASSALLDMSYSVDNDTKQMFIEAKEPYDIGNLLPFTVEKLFASLISVPKPFCDSPIMPIEIHLAYPKPTYSDRYQKVFNCPIYFEASSNKLTFDIGQLKQGIALANPIHARLGEELCEGFMSKHYPEDSLIADITNLMLRSPGCFPKMEEVASQLAMSSRTLRRRLSAMNTNFQSIYDNARQKLALEYLQNSSMRLDEISHLVGFTETTNFRRAFKRWTGNPPSQHRAKSLF